MAKKGLKLKLKPVEASPSPEPSTINKLVGRVDHLLETRGCHVLAYPTGCLDPLAIMGILYTKSGKHRKLDLFVFEDSEVAERKSSIKTVLKSTAEDKGNYYIDKVSPNTLLPFLTDFLYKSIFKFLTPVCRWRLCPPRQTF
jgi:hypothetical protein